MNIGGMPGKDLSLRGMISPRPEPTRDLRSTASPWVNRSLFPQTRRPLHATGTRQTMPSKLRSPESIELGQTPEIVPEFVPEIVPGGPLEAQIAKLRIEQEQMRTQQQKFMAELARKGKGVPDEVYLKLSMDVQELKQRCEEVLSENKTLKKQVKDLQAYVGSQGAVVFHLQSGLLRITERTAKVWEQLVSSSGDKIKEALSEEMDTEDEEELQKSQDTDPRKQKLATSTRAPSEQIDSLDSRSESEDGCNADEQKEVAAMLRSLRPQLDNLLDTAMAESKANQKPEAWDGMSAGSDYVRILSPERVLTGDVCNDAAVLLGRLQQAELDCTIRLDEKVSSKHAELGTIKEQEEDLTGQSDDATKPKTAEATRGWRGFSEALRAEARNGK